MKSYIYTLIDEYAGIPLFVEGELITFADEDCPDVIINNISHGKNYLELWAVSDRYIEHLKDRIYQQWCKE